MESKYRSRLFGLLLVVQFLVITLILFLWFAKVYSTNQLKDLLFLIIPLLSAHLIPAFDYFTQSPGEHHISNDPPKILKLLSYFMPSLYLIYMVLILLKGGSSDSSFQALKEMIGIGEVLFGVYIGIIVTKIFSTNK